jgi:hypothetical protein
MRPLSITTRFVVASLVVMTALASGVVLGQTPTLVGDRPDCVTASGVVRPDGIGYRHFVHVANACDFAVDCRISTDVNPQVQNVHVEPGGQTDVMTFLSSPARTFVARVECPNPRGSRSRTPVIEDRGE